VPARERQCIGALSDAWRVRGCRHRWQICARHKTSTRIGVARFWRPLRRPFYPMMCRCQPCVLVRGIHGPPRASPTTAREVGGEPAVSRPYRPVISQRTVAFPPGLEPATAGLEIRWWWGVSASGQRDRGSAKRLDVPEEAYRKLSALSLPTGGLPSLRLRGRRSVERRTLAWLGMDASSGKPQKRC